MTDDLPLAATAVLLREREGVVETLMIRRPERGAFGGVWVFPGGKAEADDRMPHASEQQTAERAAIRETREEVGLEIAGLQAISCWTPPPQAPARFHTWFFLCTEFSGEIVAETGEVDEWRWLSADAALAAHAEGAMRLVPPTWVTLHSLRGAASISAARERFPVIGHYRPHIDGALGHGRLIWEGDEDYDDDAPVGGRHRLTMNGADWRYERSGPGA